MDVMLGRFIKVKPSVYQLKSEAAVIDFDSGFPH